MGKFRRILRRGSLAAVLTCSPLAALAAEAEPGRYSSVDTIWILLGAALVFFMQPGFAMLETGLTRAKNAGNIVMKNFMDFALGTVFLLVPRFWPYVWYRFSRYHRDSRSFCPELPRR